MRTSDKGVVERIQDRFRREKVRILAVHPSDIESLLASLGLLEEIREGKIYCANCERLVTKDIIGKIYGENNEIKIVCDRWDCFYGSSRGKNDDDDDGDSSDGGTIDTVEEIATEAEILEALEGEQPPTEPDTEVAA